MKISAAPRFLLIGAGRIGTGLTEILVRGGMTLTGIVEKHPDRAHALLEKINCRVPVFSAVPFSPQPANWLLFCVPDDQIAVAAETLARQGIRSEIALHTSGAVNSGILQPLSSLGIATGSLHPLMPVPDPDTAFNALQSAIFSFEGHPAAREAAKNITSLAHGMFIEIDPDHKTKYHLAATFLSSLFLALLGSIERILAPMNFDDDFKHLFFNSLCLPTLNNFLRNGVSNSATGPIVRGDLDTITNHLKELNSLDEKFAIIYQYLSLILMQLIDKNDESLKNKILPSTK